jgi:hypothetical protein
MKALVKRESTNEPNVSQRTVTYDLYDTEGKYVTTYGVDQLQEAMDARAELDERSTMEVK